MKLKKYNIQFWIGIICIIFALFSGIYGSYNLHLSNLDGFVEDTMKHYSNVNYSTMTESESELYTLNLISDINIGALAIKTSWYNFIWS